MVSCPLFLSWACAHRTPADAAAIPGRVAETFAKAAVLIFDPDHVDCDKTVSEAFSAEELEILGAHHSELVSMIESALGRQESVWGAKLAGHYRLESLRSLLQSHFLSLGDFAFRRGVFRDLCPDGDDFVRRGVTFLRGRWAFDRIYNA